MRILLAEDNSTNQQVAVSILKKLGYRTDVVANGREAVKVLCDIPYDLVFMDCQMPEMDGYEATRLIRRNGSQVLNRNIPIIAMTANAMKGDREKCLDAGMNDYIAKPVSPDAIASVLEIWLSKSKEELAASGISTETDLQFETQQELTEVVSESQPEWTSDNARTEVFDRAKFIDRLMGDKDLAETIISGFLEDIPDQIAALRSALDEGNARLIEQQSHRIKGAAANIGGIALQDAANSMELAGKDGDLEKATSLLLGLEEQFDRLKRVMQ